MPIWEAAGLAPYPAGGWARLGRRWRSSAATARSRESEAIQSPADRYLLVARRAVEEAAAIEIDHLPLETSTPVTGSRLLGLRLTVAYRGEVRGPWHALAQPRCDMLRRRPRPRAARACAVTAAIQGRSTAASVIDVALALAQASRKASTRSARS